MPRPETRAAAVASFAAPGRLLAAVAARFPAVGFAAGRRTASRIAPVALLLAGAASVSAQPGNADPSAPLPLERLELPPGFEISVWGRIPGARSLTLGDGGTVFVGTRDANGSVYAIADRNGDHRADEVHTLAGPLFMPNGVAFRDGSLYVAEVNRILRFDDIERRLENPGEPAVVTTALPDMRHHGWKFIAFGPDGYLYVPVGAPCNRCDSVNPLFASIARMRPDGSGLEVAARGVRMSVGFDWHPETGEMWFTDNNPDWLGDDNPPGEMNILTEIGQHFGYPYCHAGEVADPWYGRERDCSEFVPPTQQLGPHVAAIGMTFYRGDAFPEEYRGQAFVAEHGSWNRSERIGYRMTLVRVEDGASAYEDFATGWIGAPDERAWGRPVDLLELPDGSLLLSDDRADAIYRIAYTDAR